MIFTLYALIVTGNVLSPYGITILGNTLVMRIKELIIEREISWSLYQIISASELVL